MEGREGPAVGGGGVHARGIEWGSSRCSPTRARVSQERWVAVGPVRPVRPHWAGSLRVAEQIHNFQKRKRKIKEHVATLTYIKDPQLELE